MNTRGILCFVALCSLCQGCGGPLTNVARTMIFEPIRFDKAVNDYADCLRDRKVAEFAWAEYKTTFPNPAYSLDWERGFKDGFADYLYAGGTGLPPPLPPRDYWTTDYETPGGHRAIADWFEGFRQGARSAQGSGYRNLVTVPVSSPPLGTPLPSVAAAAPPAESPAPAEELPPPKKDAIKE